MSKDLMANDNDFSTVVPIIENARGQALKAVNAELIRMYWEVGRYLSGLCANSSFGDKVIDEVANYVSNTVPSIKGFNRRGLYRMKQFYETYADDEFVSAVLTQISWTNHLLILSKAKTKEERDFYIDLLFYNRTLSCLVPIELKIGKFKPEHIGQINFYLEALDRDIKKPNENPSVGLILCAGKDDAVVEYALSRSLSPTLVSDYSLCLPDKKLLQAKLRELTDLAINQENGDF